ncbi:MAG: deaminase [Candidatus Saccharibacteria bacterium]
MTNNNEELFAGYIPVIQDGYKKAFDRHPDATIGVFGQDILCDFDYLRKDIRALEPEIVRQALIGMGRSAIILSKDTLEEALKKPIIMPKDDLTRIIKAENPDADITEEPIFLRWDRDNSSEKNDIIPDRIVKLDSDNPILKLINDEISRSPNWWRHVGALIANSENSIIISGHNSSLPTEYSSSIDGDPRITAKKGESIERSIDIHAEAKIIAEASKQGIKMNGNSIYVSTFPCPNCAKLIALSGIKSCYYVDGYAMLDGQSILKDFGVEIVKLDISLNPEDSRILKQYPTSQY